MRVKSIVESPFALGLLTGLYPALFFITNNWFVIGFAQSFYVLLTLCLVAFLVVSLTHLTLSYLPFPRRKENDESGIRFVYLPQGLVRAVLFILSFYILVGYLNFTIIDLEESYGSIDFRNLSLLAAAAIFCLCLIWALKTGGQWIDLVTSFNVLLLILTLLAFSSLTYSLISNFEAIVGAATIEDKEAKKIYDDVQFKSKPNIYLIVPDSYPSNPVLKRFFNVDNQSFSLALEQLGFRVYDRYFSSYQYSVESMYSMFSMNHNFYINTIGNDTLDLRKVIAGRNNNVTDVLKNNGYKSYYIHESDYLIKEYCFVERCVPSLSEVEKLATTLKDFYFFNILVVKHQHHVGIEMIRQIDSAEGPKFIYKHFMAAHSGVKSYKKKFMNRLAAFRAGYPQKIRKVNEILLLEVRRILDRDPSAIIVIVADHGTWGGAERTLAGFTEDEILDKFNVFLAIKWGDAYRGQYDASIKTSVNLFRFIFAFLDQDDRILETKVEDESYLSLNGIWKVVEEGDILSEPKALGSRPKLSQ